MSEEQKGAAIALGQLIYANTIKGLEQQLAAAQARIAELREALHYTLQAWHYDGISDEHGSTYAESDRRCDKPDDLSALESIKAAAKREALMEAADAVELTSEETSCKWAAEKLRRMAGEVK